MIVSDTGPLIAFLLIGRLDLLQHVVGTLVIPDAVYEELIMGVQGQSRAQLIEHSPWIERKAVTNREALALLPSQLHAGEREAIVLAQELGTQLLIDERRGRKSARDRGVQIFGSLQILTEAKRLGLISSVKPLLESMRAAGYWIHQDLVWLFLHEVGEADT